MSYFGFDFDAPYSSTGGTVGGYMPMMPVAPMVPSYGLQMRSALGQDTFGEAIAAKQKKENVLVAGAIALTAAVGAVIIAIARKGKGGNNAAKGLKNAVKALKGKGAKGAKAVQETAQATVNTAANGTKGTKAAVQAAAAEVPDYSKYIKKHSQKVAKDAEKATKFAQKGQRTAQYAQKTAQDTVQPLVITGKLKPVAPKVRGNVNTAVTPNVIELGPPPAINRHDALMKRHEFWHNKWLNADDIPLKERYLNLIEQTERITDKEFPYKLFD